MSRRPLGTRPRRIEASSVRIRVGKGGRRPSAARLESEILVPRQNPDKIPWRRTWSLHLPCPPKFSFSRVTPRSPASSERARPSRARRAGRRRRIRGAHGCRLGQTGFDSAVDRAAADERVFRLQQAEEGSALRDVPLIIMSSESSDDTFEQHRKLRTRAEDYVHKPIAFGELLEHMRPSYTSKTAKVRRRRMIRGSSSTISN